MSASERRRDHHVRHGRAAAVSRLSDPIENHDGCAKPLVFAAGALFLVGTIGVTMVGNVPLNDELVPHDPQDPSAQEI